MSRICVERLFIIAIFFFNTTEEDLKKINRRVYSSLFVEHSMRILVAAKCFLGEFPTDGGIYRCWKINTALICCNCATREYQRR